VRIVFGPYDKYACLPFCQYFCSFLCTSACASASTGCLQWTNGQRTMSSGFSKFLPGFYVQSVCFHYSGLLIQNAMANLPGTTLVCGKIATASCITIWLASVIGGVGGDYRRYPLTFYTVYFLCLLATKMEGKLTLALFRTCLRRGHCCFADSASAVFACCH